MLPVLANDDSRVDDEPALRGAEAHRAAFYLDSQGQALFAWLHAPATSLHVRHGIVLCPSVCHEQVHAHRTLRHLADALARAGMAVLRLDFAGTGDSAGQDDAAGRNATWVANVRDAITWMRRRGGCERVSLIGLRIGAAIALQAATAESVDNLVLWAPVVQGRAFVRELKALCSTSAGGAPPAAQGAGIEAAGFALNEQTLQEINALNLMTIRPRFRRALIVVRQELRAESALLEHLSALGQSCEPQAFTGFGDMMAEPHCTRVPRQAIDGIRDWLVADNDGSNRAPRFNSRESLQSEAIMPQQVWNGSGGRAVTSIRERIFWAGQRQELFGILSAPEQPPPANRPAILLVNAGASYRVGPGRLYVQLARRLAAAGLRCVRLDLSGLGDSPARRGEVENDPYAASGFRDIEQAIQGIREQCGVSHIVLMGLCSGAYFAFQSAAQFSDNALCESILINPLTFFWKEGMSLEVRPEERPELHAPAWRDVLQPRKWWNLLSGKNKLGIRGAIRSVCATWQARLRLDLVATTHAETTPAAPGHPQREDVLADLAQAAGRGRHLAFFFSRSDPGYRLLHLRAGRALKQYLRRGVMDLQLIDGADHTFSASAPRRVLIEAITAHLCRRYPAATR